MNNIGEINMIKKFNFDKMQPSRRMPKFAQILAIVGAFIVLAIYLLVKIDHWFDKNTLNFQSPIILTIQSPITVSKRIEKIKYIKEFADALPKPTTPLEEYICQKFGSDCQVALFVAKGESGMRENAFNINSNGTIDIGIFQVNSVHWSKKGCSPKELFDAYKNVDCAYKIYKGSGWGAWTVYNNQLKVK